MIKINVLEHLEKLGLGVMSFYFNTITVGSNACNNLIINSPLLSSTHLVLDTFLVTQEHYLSIESGSDNSYFRVNSKKVLGKKILKAKDIVKIDGILFEILDFKYDKPQPFGKILEEKYIALYNDPIERGLLEAIEQNLINLTPNK